MLGVPHIQVGLGQGLLPQHFKPPVQPQPTVQNPQAQFLAQGI